MFILNFNEYTKDIQDIVETKHDNNNSVKKSGSKTSKTNANLNVKKYDQLIA